MGNVYRHPKRKRTGRFAATTAAIVTVIAIAALASQSYRPSDAAHAHAASPPDRSTPTVYFPSQFELNAGPPERHIEAF